LGAFLLSAFCFGSVVALGGFAPLFRTPQSALRNPHSPQGGFKVALGSHWGRIGVALGWLWWSLGVALGSQWGAYQLAINTLWGGFDVALMSH
jgi:hypothetical protein